MKNDNELRNATDREHLVVKTDDLVSVAIKGPVYLPELHIQPDGSIGSTPVFKVTIMPLQPSHDHHSYRIGENGFGWVGNRCKTVALSKCPKCATGNYAMAEMSGCCAWCGFDVAPYKDQILKGMES